MPKTPGLDRADHSCGDCISCVDIPLQQGPVAGSASASPGLKKKPSRHASLVLASVLHAPPAEHNSAAARSVFLSPSADRPADIASSRILRI